MTTSKTSTDDDNGRNVDNASLHDPEQLPDAPPVGGGASGPGDAGGGTDTAPDHAADAPQADKTVSDAAPSLEDAQGDGNSLPDSAAGQESTTTGVDLSTIDDPAAMAAAFVSVGQLLVTQQIISAATAKYIFQGELDLVRSDSAAAAAAHPHCPGDVPPARFGVKQDSSSFIVGVPATSSDRLAERFMRDGYGGLETLAFVETLSDEDIQDLSEIVHPRLSLRPDLLLPRSGDTAPTVTEFRNLLDSGSARRELASLLQHYPVDGLARKVFKMSTLLKQTLSQLREAKRQLRSSGSRDGSELLEKLTEISAMKTGFALLNQHWKEAFLVCKRQLDQELSDHARDFKRAAQSHEQEEEALQSRLASMTQERDDMFAFARVLEHRLKAGSINVPRVMNFLNQHQTQVVGNWSRLKALLEHFKDRQVPPDTWTTQIMVTAIDDYAAQPGPFAALDEDDQRVKFLILHQLDSLNAQARSSLVDIVEFMWEHRRAFWLIGHWFFIDHRLDDYSAELHADRKKECDTAKKNYKKLLDDKVREGLPESVLEEPGIWTFPAKVCAWVWMDKSQLDDQGRPFSLVEQLRIVDELEPARVQWNSCDSDDQRVAHLNSSLRKKLLPESERHRYPVSTQRP